MDFTPLPSELEELILCSCCHLPFNETDALPKLFSCRHYFCLKCVNQVLLKGNELYCVHCWKRTELTGPDMKPDALPTHNAILYLSQNLSMISSGSITTTNKKPPDKANNGSDSCSTVATTSSTTNGGGSLAAGAASTTSGGATGNGASGSGINVAIGGGGGGAGSGGSNTSSSSVGSGISVVVTTGSSVGSSVASNGSTGMPTNGAGVIGSAVVGGGGGIGIGVGSVGGSAGTSGSGVVSAIGSGKYRSKGENCLTHAMPNALWCLKCSTAVCRACASGDDHRQHPVKTQAEARDHIRTDIASDLLLMQKSLAELQHFVFKQRDFLLKILEACTALKTQVETELINHLPTFEVAEIRSNLTKAKLFLGMLDQQSPAEAYKLYANLHMEKQRLQSKYQEMFLQCKLDDLIQHYGVLFDFDLIKQALSNLNTIDPISFGNGTVAGSAAINGHHNSILLLANYCISQLYSRHILTTKHHPSPQQQHQQSQHHQQQQQQQQHQQQQQPLPSQLGPLEGVTLGGHHYVHQQSPNHVTMNHLHHHVAQQLHHHQQQQQQHQQQLTGSGTYACQLHDMASAILIAPSQDRMAPGSGRATGDGSSSARTSGSGSGYLSEILNGAGSSSALHQHAALQQQHSSQLASPGGLISSSSCSSVVSLVPAPSSSAGSSSVVVGAGKGQSAAAAAAAAAAVAATLLCNPSVHVYPIYFFSIEINGQPFGRILIEVRNDVAPKMAKNFGALCTGELGFGYKGCSIFQCWENESIITGDFELNNGRGGRSVFEEGFFMPDDTKILAIRGSVGMRRSQKRHDNMGLVGSQFRIILREMRGFTGIFAFVVEGLELVEKISQAGDSAGKPQSTVLIANCGKWQ
ncbi:hormone receptor 4 isoform X2 [Anopheles funestus]|nr:hormone receptor 4 isoform X2 [Anopheles funestus]XP_049288290.1 hormone receptor 4 isoform X2 [Anopheles funestus]XP_049288291.1 hormone receptor 4 isoform X2 [Anopheles funestus]XP_049288292.1 hormone receptor 4 isoform X2 [Anopheles funestus]XP_049288293.1 hormone receptor 4 isoform X2 [Anopheles funestus]